MYILTSKILKKLKQELGDKLNVFLIPHVIDQYNGCDLQAMQEHFKHIRQEVKPQPINHNFVISQTIRPEEVMHTITGQMDIVIASRYHGVIFALSQNVPVLGLYENSYYQAKIVGALHVLNMEDLLYQFTLDIRQTNSNDKASVIILNLVHNNQKHKNMLAVKNSKIMQQENAVLNLFKKMTEKT